MDVLESSKEEPIVDQIENMDKQIKLQDEDTDLVNMSMVTAGTHREEAHTTKGRMRMYAQKLIARKILAAKKTHHSALATMPPLDE